MTIAEFESAGSAKFEGALLALWWDGKGEWERAHEVAQEVPGTDGAWVHAFCTGRRATWGTPRIGIDRRAVVSPLEIFEWSGRGLWGRCWGGGKSAVRSAARMPTVATIKLSRRWGTRQRRWR